MIKLNSSRSSRNRYYLMNDGIGMGGYGLPDNHVNKKWVVVNGIDRGNGYQGYSSVTYTIAEDSPFPEDVKVAIRKHLNL